jgi:DNA-binding HxlR family transcriptional regulator
MIAGTSRCYSPGADGSPHMVRSRAALESRAPSVAATVSKGDVNWSEIDASFRRFRESAVRLVEHVNDLLDSNGGRTPGADRDLRLVRSVFGKWSAEILDALHTAPAFGFEDLRRHLPGISPRVLSLKLKELEEHGMVVREILAARPPRVRYTLTERGWTVAWLADPVLLYLRQTEARGENGSAGHHRDATPD